MSTFFPLHPRTHLEERTPVSRPGPVPEIRLNQLQRPTLVVRQDSSSTSSSSAAVKTTCGPNDTTGVCQRYTSSDLSQNTLPIVLGVIIPLVGALVLFVLLHRRHVKKLRKEDLNDAHKSLDFGLEGSGGMNEKGNGARKGQHGPEVSLEATKESIRRQRGLSMDMDLANPYILPHGLQSSRESLHSLSRSMNGDDDKYQRTTFVPNGGSPYPTSLRSPADDSSSFTGSSRRRFDIDGEQSLIRHAQRNSRSMPQSRSASTDRGAGASANNNLRKPAAANTKNGSLAPGGPDGVRDSYMSTTSSVGPNAAIRASNNYLAAYIRGGDMFVESKPESRTKEAAVEVKPALSPPESDSSKPSTSPPAVYKGEMPKRQDHNPVLAERVAHRAPQDPSISSSIKLGPPPQVLATRLESEAQLPEIHFPDEQAFPNDFRLPEVDVNGVQKSQKAVPPTRPSEDTRLSQQQSTLPQLKSHEAQHAEDEYEYEYEDDVGEDDAGDYDISAYGDDLGYDPRRLTMGTRPLPPDDPYENPEQRANRIRSFYKEYFEETKAPGKPSRQDYYDGSEQFAYNGHGGQYGGEQYYDQAQHYPPYGPARFTGPERHRATVSSGSYGSGPRAFSSASGRYGPSGRRPPTKQLPPPKPLHALPTPHLLKDDSFIPIDYAPPPSYGARRAGTPDSLRGGLRPYSPGARAHVPLVSSFDDLSAMPSPHALRKSRTFNNLDFAPPPRFRTGDSSSDSGSIRSNRSAVSAMQVHNIRTGAYRVSRIPKEVAGTKDELNNALRPQMSLITPA